MKKFALIALGALILALPLLLKAADQPAHSGAKPSSFVPHAPAQHVYGSPMQPAGRHTKTTHHHRPAPKT